MLRLVDAGVAADMLIDGSSGGAIGEVAFILFVLSIYYPKL